MQRHFAAWLLIAVALTMTSAADLPAQVEPAVQSFRLTPFTSPPDLFPIVTGDRQDAWRKLVPSPEKSLQTVADCRFTVVGFVRPEDLPVC